VLQIKRSRSYQISGRALRPPSKIWNFVFYIFLYIHFDIFWYAFVWRNWYQIDFKILISNCLQKILEFLEFLKSIWYQFFQTNAYQKIRYQFDKKIIRKSSENVDFFESNSYQIFWSDFHIKSDQQHFKCLVRGHGMVLVSTFEIYWKFTITGKWNSLPNYPSLDFSSSSSSSSKADLMAWCW
jgi:hypothetical protein